MRDSNSYKGCWFAPRGTKTSIIRNKRRIVANCWEVGGRYAKGEAVLPILTSAKGCRDYINEQDREREGVIKTIIKHG